MKLSTWLSEHDIADARFAELVGVSRQALFRYRTGERIPRPAVMARIVEATGGAVTANDFFASPETVG